MNSTPASRRDGSKYFANRLFFQSRAYGLQRQSAINTLPVFRANSHAAPRQMIRSPSPTLRLDTIYPCRRPWTESSAACLPHQPRKRLLLLLLREIGSYDPRRSPADPAESS
jgi:hypothetical protein